VNDERLVYNLTDLRIAQGEVKEAPGLFAVNRDGSGFRQLVEKQGSWWKRGGEEELLLPGNTRLLGPVGKQDSNDVFVVKYEGYGKSVDTYTQLQRLNTLTGRATLIDTPPYSVQWLIDQSGTPRIVQTVQGKMIAVRYNDPATGQWRKLAEFDFLSEGRFEPVSFGPDKTLYVRAANGKDKQAIYRYDLEHNQVLPKPVAASDSYDINAGFTYSQGKLLGLRYSIDGEITQWLDADMAATQKDLDARFPATTNRITFGLRSETPFVIVDTFSDVQPSVFYLYNTATKKLIKLGSAHPDIDPKQMAQKDMVRYKARDGLEIPAYITMPAGPVKKNLPMVVMVHGGPNVRGGYWNWDPQAQFLASRGYVVLEPEYRGSTGFGTRHFKAGWKQWGLGMQGDIADGAKWAIAQGIADPKRICIGGASYGGYATLMGLVNDPDLFRCGFEWVGVTDIGMMYTVYWSDFPDIVKQYWDPILIGDPVKDAAQFKATSPLEQAARIKQPLLLAYGGADQRVPKVHGTRFYDAVKTGNTQVEWVLYDQEGHGWALEKNRIDFWGRVEKFLARNIGAPAGTP